MSGHSEKTPADKLVGANIRFFRLKREISEASLLEQLGCSLPYLESVEQGEVRVRAAVLYDLAMLFGCRMSDFFDPNAAPSTEDQAARQEPARKSSGGQ